MLIALILFTLAYHLGGQIESALRVLSVLIQNAIAEERFNDAGYLHWLLASQSLEIAQSAQDQRFDKQYNQHLILKIIFIICSAVQTWTLSYLENEKLATIYYAFHMVHQCINEVFSVCQPETLFNASKIVLSLLDKFNPVPKGISLLYPFSLCELSICFVRNAIFIEVFNSLA